MNRESPSLMPESRKPGGPASAADRSPSRSQSDVDALLGLPRIPGKTVYVLGAGFSYPLGLPLIRDFIPKGLALLKQPTKRHPKGCYEIVAEVIEVVNRYRRPLSAMPDREPNLEDIFSYADLLWEQNGAQHKILAGFVLAVCDHALALKKEGRADINWNEVMVPRAHFKPKPLAAPAPKNDRKDANGDLPGVTMYEAFLSQLFTDKPAALPDKLQRKDEGGYGASALVCLNYDRVVEETLMDLGNDNNPNNSPGVFYGFGCIEDEEPWNADGLRVPLIKLHGSIDWRQCGECLKVSLAGGAAWAACKKHSPKNPSDSLLTNTAMTPLIYPSWQRGRGQGSLFDRLLTEARIHLRLAQRIVFIGYSLPPSDRHIAYLLADALDTAEPPEIETANQWPTDENARRNVRAMMGDRAARQLKRNYSMGLRELVMSWRHSSIVK